MRRRRLARLDATLGFLGDLPAVRFAAIRRYVDQQPATIAVRDYLAALGTGSPGPRWLYLWGPTGDGKTTLLAAAVNALRQQGREAVFAVVPELLSWLRAAFDSPVRSFDEDWDYVKRVDVLALDDLGTEKSTDWTRERLYELFGWRYRQQLPTLVTSNLHPSELGDGRITSRLCDVMLGRVIQLGPNDIRSVKR